MAHAPVTVTHCPYASLPGCVRYGAASVKRCRACGSDTYAESGLWAVVPWRGDGRYSIGQAHATYRSRTLADRRAATIPDAVVRFVDG